MSFEPDLRLGDYRTALADVERVDCVITDPPYGARTHSGQRHGRKDARYGIDDGSSRLSSRGLSYEPWGLEDVDEFCASWVPRCTGWICVFTSHDLCSTWSDALEAHGRYVFAPLACVQHAMNVRLAGDGPSNWTTWLVVARQRSMRAWGSLPGAYVGPSHDDGENALDRSKRAVAGAKPLWLMRSIVKDYSCPSDTIVDPCGGGFTTAVAAAIEGRHCVSCEQDPKTFELGKARVARDYTHTVWNPAHKIARQAKLVL